MTMTITLWARSRRNSNVEAFILSLKMAMAGDRLIAARPEVLVQGRHVVAPVIKIPTGLRRLFQ